MLITITSILLIESWIVSSVCKGRSWVRTWQECQGLFKLHPDVQLSSMTVCFLNIRINWLRILIIYVFYQLVDFVLMFSSLLIDRRDSLPVTHEPPPLSLCLHCSCDNARFWRNVDTGASDQSPQHFKHHFPWRIFPVCRARLRWNGVACVCVCVCAALGFCC